MRQPSPNRFLSVSLKLFAAAILLLASGCQVQSPPVTTDATKRTIPVKTVAVVEENIERSTTQPATVHAYYEVDVLPKLTGYVGNVLVDIGDPVKKGDSLATLDVPEMDKQKLILEARIARHQAVEKQAEAGIDLAKADVLSAEARLAQAKSDMDRADASLAAAEAEFQRTEDLVKRQSIEPRLLDEVRKKRDSEVAAKQSVTSAIESANADVTVAKAKLSSAQADLTAAEAETQIAERQLDELSTMMEYLTLKAPFDGVITQRSVDPGDLVKNADGGKQSSLFVISQLSKVRVHVPVPEADAAHINRGDALTITFPFYPDEAPVTATVTRMSNSLDPTTRTMLVEAEIDNPDGKLLPGMFGQASIKTSTKVAAKMLPARAIRFDESGNAYVYALDASDTVSVVNITTGLDDGHSIEVLQGLEANQRVIDNHLKRFTDGQQVEVLAN